MKEGRHHVSRNWFLFGGGANSRPTIERTVLGASLAGESDSIPYVVVAHALAKQVVAVPGVDTDVEKGKFSPVEKFPNGLF